MSNSRTESVCFIPVELRMILILVVKVGLLLLCRLLPVDLKLRLDLLELLLNSSFYAVKIDKLITRNESECYLNVSFNRVNSANNTYFARTTCI